MRSIVLSGFMGTGKSTVGPLVARTLGVPFVDTDDRIAGDTGTTVAELWRRDGERAFRLREQALVQELLADPSPRVIAFGGGTVTNRHTRHVTLERAVVITLTARPETIAQRVGDALDRPNLASSLDARDPGGKAARTLARIADLLDQRSEAYGEAHACIETDAAAPDLVARAVLDVAERDPLVMPLGRRSYVVELVEHPVDVVDTAERVGDDRLAEVLAHLRPSHLVVVTDANVASARGCTLEKNLKCLQVPRTLVTLDPGEANKTLGGVCRIWDAALRAGIDRRAVVVAFGGGVVGDLAGFAASTLLRGLRVVQVPTTLLAMVDASVGGKTGFDHDAGKNLLGTFHQPAAVVVDLEHISTLPPREIRAGLAEIVKVALVADAPLLGMLENVTADVVAAPSSAMSATLRPIVRAAIAAKIRIVRDDEREGGRRALLNLGHTVGHALEAHGQYSRYLHGEAVAIGTLAEMELGVALGLTPRRLVERARDLLAALGLPTLPQAGELAAAWPFVHADKKRDGDDLRLPVVRSAGVASVERVSMQVARSSLAILDGALNVPKVSVSE